MFSQTFLHDFKLCIKSHFLNIFRNDSSKRLSRKRQANKEYHYEQPPKKTRKKEPRDPSIQVAKTKRDGKKSSLLPISTSHSEIKRVKTKGLAVTKNGVKKPNGKGYSVGQVGEEKIVTPSSPKKRTVSQKKKGSLGRKTKGTQQKAKLR